MVTYSKRTLETTKQTKTLVADRANTDNQTKSDRVMDTLNTVGSRLKRLSMTVADVNNSLRTHRKSFITDRGDGQRDSIDLSDLERLQTDNISHYTFQQWLDKMTAEQWTVKKCAESTFSEVFLATNDGKSMVIKVMPLAEKQSGTCGGNGEETTPIPVPVEAAFHEISALTAIRDRVKQVNKYAVPSGWTGFANLIEYQYRIIVINHRFSIVDGPFPVALCEEFKEWAARNKSYNQPPDTIKAKKFAVLCLENGGKSLEDCLKELTGEQMCSVLKQIVVAMSVLEKELLFEHRDLYKLSNSDLYCRHLGNVLVKSCPIDHIEVPNCPSIKTEGLQCSIIDCSISRFTTTGMVHYRDLEADQWIFEGDAAIDPQYEVYRLMRSTVNHDWRPFNPRTNLLWIKHIVDCMIAKLPKKAKLFVPLEQLSKRLLDYPDLRTVLRGDEFFGRKK